MKTLRFHLLALLGRVIRNARWLIIRLGWRGTAPASIAAACQTIRQLASAPEPDA